MEKEKGKIYTVQIDTVFQDPQNANKHTKEQIKQLQESLLEFGQMYPIIVSSIDGTIVKGNGTHLAAKASGWETIDVVFSFLEKEREQGFSIADNNLGRKSTWDLPMLAESLKSYKEWDSSPNWSALGFSESEIAPLLEADWTGSGSAPEENLGNAEEKPKFKSIKFDESVFEFLQECFNLLRKREDCEKLPDAACIELFAAEWFSSQQNLNNDEN